MATYTDKQKKHVQEPQPVHHGVTDERRLVTRPWMEWLQQLDDRIFDLEKRFPAAAVTGNRRGQSPPRNRGGGE